MFVCVPTDHRRESEGYQTQTSSRSVELSHWSRGWWELSSWVKMAEYSFRHACQMVEEPIKAPPLAPFTRWMELSKMSNLTFTPVSLSDWPSVQQWGKESKCLSSHTTISSLFMLTTKCTTMLRHTVACTVIPGFKQYHLSLPLS